MLYKGKVEVDRARGREESHKLLRSGDSQHVVQGSCMVEGMEWEEMKKKG